jgi:multiple sugar transport system permease protein
MATSLAAPPSAPRSHARAPRLRAWSHLPWLLPLGLLLALVLVYPVIEIIRLSFTDASLVSGEPYDVTIEAYASLVQGSDFRDTLRITFVFVLFSTVFQILLGFAAALLVHGAERRGLRGTVLTRTTVMTAWAVPGVIIGVIWSLLYQESESGILNHGLSLIGFSGQTPFLSDPDLALASVTVANIWRGTALSMILCYAGLKTIPDDVYEAARIDGAGAVATLFRITVPMMLPILLTNLVLVTVETFNTFDMVLALTGGGPGNATTVLALDLYDQMFRQLNLGRGAATAVVLMLINVVMIALYFRLVERTERTA